MSTLETKKPHLGDKRSKRLKIKNCEIRIQNYEMKSQNYEIKN